MKILVVGANGATGRHLVKQLMSSGHKVKAIVRPSGQIPDYWKNNDNLTLIRGNVTEMGVDEIAKLLAGCQAVASCLGHNLTRKGIFGKPRRLVTDSVKLLCRAIHQNSTQLPVRFLLMNTVGNRNRDLNEPVSFAQKIALGMLRLMVPPHSDNEQAADFLRVNIGQHDPQIEWAIVRPDSLIDNDAVTDYELFESPVRSALFNPGKTSRINAGHFMAQLLMEDDPWRLWKGKMPVIYNKN